jgi:hypothetical protein
VFFVIDSHKPTDVCNVYNNGQVRWMPWDINYLLFSIHLSAYISLKLLDSIG